METRRYEFVLDARQPVAHHEETFGNNAVIMRRKIRQTDGGWVRVPVVTGDTMRHGMREAAAYAFLDAAGLLESPSLSEPALRLLFSGGQVTGSAGGSVKLAEYREMVELIPTMALLGGCAQNRIVPGRLCVDDAVLICRENEHLLPEWVLQFVAERGGTDTCRAHVEAVQRVRMDPSLDPGKRRLLATGEAEASDLRLLQSENASEMRDARAKDDTKSTMMPRTFERVAHGSLFYWTVTATCYTDLDKDTFDVACATFLADARVGGKRGTGHGLLAPVIGRDVTVSKPAERSETIHPDTLSATRKVGQVFRAHVSERADQIASFLGQVVA